MGIRFTAWVNDRPRPIIEYFDTEAQAEAFRTSLGDRLCGAIRESGDFTGEEDARFNAAFERFSRPPEVRSIAQLSCRALVPEPSLYNERYGTYEFPMADRRKQCSTPNALKLAA